MKKVYSLIIAASVLFSGNCQEIEIYKAGTAADISGTTIIGSWTGSELKYLLDIKNTSGSTKNLVITRAKIEELSGAEDYFCWGRSLSNGYCYSGALVTPHNPWTAPNDFNFEPDSMGILWVYHDPIDDNDVHHYGSAHYRYYIVEDGIRLDSIDVINNYFLSNEESKPADISVFPNPAKDILNITVENLDGTGSISIYDIAGKVVSNNIIKNGKNQLNIEAINPGVYFYTLRNKEGIIETKKLLIQ